MTRTLNSADIEVIAPNLKRRLSGVTSTVLRLVPIQSEQIGIVTTGPGLPDDLPHVSLASVACLPRDRLRVWHARRNTEMVLGLILRGIFRRRLALLFTSAAQRHHTGFTKSLIARMDRVVATTRKAAGYLDRSADVVMHGIDTTLFHPADDRAELRRALGLPTGPLIGCFGRIRHQKGTDVLIDALIQCLPDLPGAHAVILGRVLPKDQGFRAELDQRLAEAGLHDRVTFKGEVPWEDVLTHYRALDLYVAPQRWEGFGLTPLEAMASGVPVVATPVGAFDETVLDGETGSIVPAGDAGAMAEAIHAWLSDPDRLAVAAHTARKHVLANFPIEREAAQLVAIYRQMLTAG